MEGFLVCFPPFSRSWVLYSVNDERTRNINATPEPYLALGCYGAVTEWLKVVAFTSDCPVLTHRAVGPNPTRSTFILGARRSRCGIAIESHSWPAVTKKMGYGHESS